MAERRLVEGNATAPALFYIGTETHQVPSDPRMISWLIEKYACVVERRLGRLAAQWPESIDPSWLEAHGLAALRRALMDADTVNDLQTLAPGRVEARLRQLLAGTSWYREAMLERARPLCEAWRGAMMGGREPTDAILCSKLHLSPDELAQRFIEFASVFAVEPAVLLPCQSEEGWGVHEIMLQLPGDQQLACSLYFDEELTLSEIAVVMGQEQTRVQELLGRAMVALVSESRLG